ncbi:MAG: hypothetical protein CVV27_17195, partial [Candidatus Melainabacteria bacterium HGW-Melainabacteria-1]
MILSDQPLQQELAAALNQVQVRDFHSIEVALEAIFIKYYIPDLVLLCLPEPESRRFCEYFLADLHLALIPVLLIGEQSLSVEVCHQWGVAESLPTSLTPDMLQDRVIKYAHTRRKWWKSLHIYAAERPESLLKTLGLEHRRSSYVERDGSDRLQHGHSENFSRFCEFLYDRLDYCRERSQHLQNYSSAQIYELGMALYLDSFQMAGHLADFFELKTISNLDSFELVIGAIPDLFCRRNLVLPLLDETGRQYVAISNPFQLEVLDILAKIFKHYELLIAPPELIEDVLNPDFHNTERYREWQAMRHVRSGISRDQLTRAKRDLFGGSTGPSTSARPAQRTGALSCPDLDAMIQAVDDSASLARQVGDSDTEERISRAHQAYLDQSVWDEPLSGSQSSLERDPEAAPIIHLVNGLIEKAHDSGASDIHIEPQENEIVIRYRIDGQLRIERRLQPQSMIKPIVTRLKIMSQLDISERRLPQDGQIPFVNYSPRHDITLRVSIVPLKHGEKVVIRILDPKQNLLELEDMGFSPLALSHYRQKINAPYGMILHVGPTGSGKTTTLYAALNEINDPDLNIHTIENPVEYSLPGINQLEIKHEIGLDFARALRAYLRQDPDVILVGEIRDEETAQVAIEASMTGHLLFSTLHTNDAASTILRLVEMGIKPYMVTSSLLLICAQRLLRRLCMECRRPYEADIGVKHLLGISGDQKLILYAAAGCEQCHHTGYSGRIGVYELLLPNDALRQVMNQPQV